MENNRLKSGSPLYVETYNKILKNIQDGLYDQENKLPSEVKLARQMGVSRVTLRLALHLLQEDGVIESRKGAGNFLRDKKKYVSSGLETKGNVLEKCGIVSDKIVCVPCLRQSTLYTENIFERHVPVLLSASQEYYSKKECVAKCFSTLPTDVKFVSEIDMMDPGQVIELIKKKVYEYAKVGKVDITVLESIKTEFRVRDCAHVILTEKLIDGRGEVICINKYYIPAEKTDIRVTSS